ASASDGTGDVAANLASQISSFFGAATNSTDGYEVAQGTGTNANQLTITNGSGTAMKVFTEAATGGTAGSSASSGGLGALSQIDVTSDSGATGALKAIDGLISQAVDASAAFGSAQGRLETQSSFISNLTDSLKSGIGSMVDADMEEASARLQALQVQQQLGVQSLSIANQAPQSILSLFR
ncbi:MAG: flagellin, partial [Celeribacter marinus]